MRAVSIFLSYSLQDSQEVQLYFFYFFIISSAVPIQNVFHLERADRVLQDRSSDHIHTQHCTLLGPQKYPRQVWSLLF